MTFLNPLLLFGLIAAAIPIIIHLLNLRKLKTVEFSTLQFLKELQKTKMRRVKIRQWLLLALRTLLIIAVVMAFSRPAMRGSLAGFGGATTAKTTLVILLDDSPSMNVRNERGTFFAQAKEAASRILDVVKDGDELHFVTLSSIRHAPTINAAHSPAPIRAMLEQLTPSQETFPFRDALGVAAKLISESKNFNREVYLITDAQATQFAQRGRADTTDLFDDHVKLFLADVRSGSTTRIDNAGITSAEISSKIVTQNKPLTIKAQVQNAGSSALRNAALSVYLDGSRVFQHSMDIEQGGIETPALSVVPKRRGIIKGYLRLEDDAFEADNIRHFVVNVPDIIRVLGVGASTADTRLAHLALTLDRDTSVAGLFAVEQITETQLSSHDLNKSDVLILSGVRDFSTGEADRIAQFVNGGGGLMLFAGKDMNINNYNDVLFPKLGMPKMLPPKLVGTADQPVSGFLSFQKIEFEHPLFAGLFEQQQERTTQPAVESPRVLRTLVPQAGTKGHTIISLSDGTGFLTEYQHGAGRILLFSVEAGLTWSDFPLKGIFVPLLYRSGLYLSQAEPPSSSTAGDEITIHLRLRNRSDKDAFVLRSPSGIDERVVPQFMTQTSTASFSSTASAEAGMYELRKLAGEKEGELLHAVPVNIASSETDLTHASDEIVNAFFASVGLKPEQVRRLSGNDKIDTVVLESRFGIELWKYFVGLALLFALIEMAIGRESKEQKI
ncbi:MAG: BatA domain-containing protein [Bacteroidetes bacterium]|nr:BatA domain-containing protein [Bacteroidota bacterium]MCW5893972.1 BatA domain-containing protein [Bacteroidota bacterium]